MFNFNGENNPDINSNDITKNITNQIIELSLFTIFFILVSQSTGTEYLPSTPFDASYKSLMKCIVSG